MSRVQREQREPRETGKLTFAAMAAAAATLTERDRVILSALAAQRVLTTPLIAELGFESLITTRHRMAKLTAAGVVTRFRPFVPVGSVPWHYVLTPLGASVVAVEQGDDPVPARARARRDADLTLANNAHLRHTLGTSAVYTGLRRSARSSDGRRQLAHWKSERELNATVKPHSGSVRPDGAGTWRELSPDGTWHGLNFVLEFDTGTEKQQILAEKLNSYANVLQPGIYGSLWDRIAFPNVAGVLILFVFLSARREAGSRHVFERLVAERSGRPGARQMARTATAVHAPGVDPTGALWKPLKRPNRPSPPRLSLATLPDWFYEAEQPPAPIVPAAEVAEDLEDDPFAIPEPPPTEPESATRFVPMTDWGPVQTRRRWF